MDYITIDKLKVFCNHGVYDDEKAMGQNFYVSTRVYLDADKASEDDDLKYSVNYAELCHRITDYMTNNCFDLIETLANRLSDYILAEYPIIKALELTIHKPEAPIGLPFSDVSFTVKRQWVKAYIALGSNMGDREGYLNMACTELSDDARIRLLKRSSFIQTPPYGDVVQDDFLNGVLEIETYYSAEALLDVLHTIEQKANRERVVHWGPRTLDLDILLYDDLIVSNERLTIPHRDMQNRLFVLEPLCEIAPYAYNPRLRKDALQLLEELKEES